MKKNAKKVLKILGWTVLGIFAFVLVLVLALPLWIGPVACGVANSVTPGITQTEFNLGHFALNPYSGHVEVGNMQLANPTNFSEKNAVDLNLLTVDLSTFSLMSDTICIQDITVDGLKVYLDAPDVANFKQIAANAAGEDSVSTNDAEVAEQPKEETATEGEKRVVIDRIALKNIVIQYGMLPIPLPDFEIHDIGRDSETGTAQGATYEEVWQQIVKEVTQRAEGLGKGLFKLGKAGLSAATEGTDIAAEKVNDAAKKGVKSVLKETDKAIKFVDGLFK